MHTYIYICIYASIFERKCIQRQAYIYMNICTICVLLNLNDTCVLRIVFLYISFIPQVTHVNLGFIIFPSEISKTLAPLEGLLPHGAAPNTASPREKACSLEKLEQAWLGHEKSAYILRQSFQVGLPWGRASWVLSSSARCSSPRGVLHSRRRAAQDHQPPERAPQPKNTRASSA